MTLPLFENNNNNKHHSSPKDSLQANLSTKADQAAELSLIRKGSVRKAWGDTASRMFLKAKAGVDAIRGTRSHQLYGIGLHQHPSPTR